VSKLLALKPRISEKAYALSEASGTYVFDVSRSANKHTVAQAVAEQYSVKVASVRLANVAGKAIRLVRRRGRSQDAKRSDIRKAYVTLIKGEKMPLFAATENEKAAKKETK